MIDGLWSAVRESERRYGITSKLIMCFLRDLTEESAMATLEQALPYGERIVAVGLDSAEVGHPPSKFRDVFERGEYVPLTTAGEKRECVFAFARRNGTSTVVACVPRLVASLLPDAATRRAKLGEERLLALSPG